MKEHQPKVTWSERVRIWWFLARVGVELSELSGKQTKRWRQLRRSLKADIVEAAASVGVDQAIADLGSPAELGQQFDLAIRGPRAPKWLVGTLAAGATSAVLVAVWMAYTFGLMDALYLTGGGRTPWVNVIGLDVQAFSDAEGLGLLVQPTTGWWAVPLVLVAVFLIFSRVWRMRRPASETVSEALTPA